MMYNKHATSVQFGLTDENQQLMVQNIPKVANDFGVSWCLRLCIPISSTYYNWIIMREFDAFFVLTELDKGQTALIIGSLLAVLDYFEYMVVRMNDLENWVGIQRQIICHLLQ